MAQKGQLPDFYQSGCTKLFTIRFACQRSIPSDELLAAAPFPERGARASPSAQCGLAPSRCRGDLRLPRAVAELDAGSRLLLRLARSVGSNLDNQLHDPHPRNGISPISCGLTPITIIAYSPRRSKRLHVTATLDVDVVEAAAEAGHLQILEFLYEHSSAVTSRQVEGNRQRQNPPGVAVTTDLVVCWGRYDMEKAAKQGHDQIVRWVHERTAFADDTRCQSRIVKYALERGDLQLVQWLLAYGFPEVSLDAVLTGRADVVAWLLARGRLEEERVAACAMKNLARGGNLELMQRLVQVHVPDPHRSWLWRSSWLGALEAASQHGHLPEVQWLIQHSVGRALPAQLKFSFAMHKAAANGHLEVAQYLHKHGFRGCSARTMFSAAINGHLRVVRWLFLHFVDEAFFHAQTLPVHLISHVDQVHCSVAAMEAAAINGHLEVLQFLHRLDVLMGANARKRARGEDERVEGRRPTATHRAMDGAAGNGHLDVIQWLHVNRSEGCTTAAMDAAAANGHLHVVQWLHDNTSEGCTAAAVNSAAANGHLDLVQWLHANRSEGCTDKALDSAAAGGHLRVVHWLLNHHISSQVPSASAVQKAGSTSFEMLLFLHTQCPASFTSRVVASMLDSVPDHIRAWLVVHYPSHST